MNIELIRKYALSEYPIEDWNNRKEVDETIEYFLDNCQMDIDFFESKYGDVELFLSYNN